MSRLGALVRRACERDILLADIARVGNGADLADRLRQAHSRGLSLADLAEDADSYARFLRVIAEAASKKVRSAHLTQH